MKDKPHKHKVSNTFKFKGFGEKARDLRISARRFLLKRLSDSEDSNTFLYEELCKWQDLNLTSVFQAFQHALGQDVQTMAQLVFHEAHIVKTLTTYLDDSTSLAQQPLLHLLVAFASDMPDVFYNSHFYHFLKILIKQLSTRDTERIEAIFLCIVSLFVVLNKHLHRDLYRLYHEENFAILFSKSYPWYVNELAAQCLGFLVRKLPCKDEFLEMAMRKLKKDESQTQGLGRLLCNTMKSDVVQRLHSSASLTLSSLLDLLGSKRVPSGPALQAILYATTSLANHVTTPNVNMKEIWKSYWMEDSSTIWPVFFKKLQSLMLCDESIDKSDHLLAILQVMQLLIEHKHGCLVTNFPETMSEILSLIQNPLPDRVCQTMCAIISSLMMSQNQLVSCTLMKQVMSAVFILHCDHTILFSFIEQLISCPRFDKEILPSVLSFLNELMGKSSTRTVHLEIMALLSLIILQKQPPCKTGMDFLQWNKYRLDFSFHSPGKTGVLSVPLFIESVLSEGLREDKSNMEDLALCLSCLPHVAPIDYQEITPYLTWILNDTLDLLRTDTDVVLKGDIAPHKRRKNKGENLVLSFDLNVKICKESDMTKFMLLVALLVEAMSHMLETEDFINSLSQLEMLLLLRKNPQYRESVHLLKALDLYLTLSIVDKDSDILCNISLHEVYSILAPSLSSSNAMVRLLVAHIFSLFPVSLPVLEKRENTETVFEVIVKAELVPVTPWDYKERLRYLLMIDAEHVRNLLPIGGLYDQAPFIFLIGQLFINFKEMWFPVIKSIATFAHFLSEDNFWPVWLTKLKLASHEAHQDLTLNTECENNDSQFVWPQLDTLHVHLVKHTGFSNIPTRVDRINYRELLWRAMQLFPDICEPRNKDLVPLFFNFLEQELFPIDFTTAPTQDVTRLMAETLNNSELDHCRSMEFLRKTDDSVSNKEDQCANTNNSLEVKRRKVPQNTLCEHLALFARFQNPKGIYMASRLEEIYNEFLAHPAPKVQRLALDCIMAYKYKYLTPYRENLCRILDDRTFKNEITSFSIDCDSEIALKDEHRKDFMPVLMRILYGKMHYKTGPNSVGRSHINTRKSVVLRFIAGAKECELETFLNLCFEVFLEHLHGSVLEVVTKSRTDIDLTKIVPLKRIQAGLNTMENIFEKICNLLTTNMSSWLLKLCLYINSTVSVLLEKRDEIESLHMNALKSLRQLAVKRLIYFFRNFQSYPWTTEELDAVFQAAVWPSLKRLPDEGIYSVTPLLELLICWAESPRYFPLLAICHPDDQSFTPLPFIVQLLNHSKCSVGVVSSIWTMVDHLLTLEDNGSEHFIGKEENSNGLPLQISNSVNIEKIWSRDGNLQPNYGTSLLIPYVDGLFNQMKNMILRLGKGQCMNARDLGILSRLSEWVISNEHSGELLQLIIPLLVKQAIKNIEKNAKLLETCCYLLENVDNANEYLDQLLVLFSNLENRMARDALCRTVAVIAKKFPNFVDISVTATELNSWNPRMVDEVDFDRRIKQYQWLACFFKQCHDVDEPMCRLVVYHCMYVVTYVDDSSLRDLSSLCLGQLFEMLKTFQIQNAHSVRLVLEGTLLPLIKAGLRHKKETVREDVISLLGKMVLKCSGNIGKLVDLAKLADETDQDSDFFSNMCHIQKHRRARAMIRFAEKLNSGVLSLNCDILTDYLLPMVSVFLFKTEYASDDFLLTSSVNCIGAIAKLLPWYSYQQMLRYYLKVMSRDLDQLKLGVKVLDVILEAFHEDVEASPNNFTYKRRHTSEKQIDADDLISEKNENFVNEDMDSELLKDAADHEIVLKITDKGVNQTINKGQKVYNTIVLTIIPEVMQTLGSRLKSEMEHKVNKSKYPEDEDIKRIPLAFAMIKLMKKLPKKVLDANINNVLMKIISFLKSRASSIRDEARSMLVKIMLELGGSYLPWLVRDMQSILTKGFQSHVLVFTLHAVLVQLKSVISEENIDSCLPSIVEICKEDLLGHQAEEKHVGQITGKVKEARGDKSYAIIGIAAEFVSVDNLNNLIFPLKEVLTNTQDKAVVRKITRCLGEIANGIEHNKKILLEHKSLFVYGILSERLTDLSVTESSKKISKVVNRTDSFLLLPEPKRAGNMPKTTFKATVHVLMEFALNLLWNMLKRDQFSIKTVAHHSQLDPYVVLVKKCITSEHPEVSFRALKCLQCLLKFPLVSIPVEISSICSHLFDILGKFCSAELAKGKLFDLVQLTFKTLALIMRSCAFHSLSADEIRILLHYVKETLEDSSQYQTAFNLLQAILWRKVDAEELHSIMLTVQEKSVTSTNEFVLDQARRTFYTYLTTYPFKEKRLYRPILYYLANVSYAQLEGRLSSTIMIHDIITNFPSKLFNKQLEANIWYKLSEQIVCEESKENQMVLNKALCTLFSRSRNQSHLLELCLKLLDLDGTKTLGQNALSWTIAGKSLNAFCDGPKDKLPAGVYASIIPKLITLLNPDVLNVDESLSSFSVDGECSVTDALQIDNVVVVLLDVFMKLVDMYVNDKDFMQLIPSCTWNYIQSHLLYPHLHARLLSARLLGRVMDACPIEKGILPCFIISTEKACSLAMDFCEQLKTEAPSSYVQLTQLSLNVVRNLIYLVQLSGMVPLVLKKSSGAPSMVDDTCVGSKQLQSDGSTHIELSSAMWVLKRVGNVAYEELQTANIDRTLARETLLNLMAGLVVVTGSEANTVSAYVVKHLARELSDEHLPKVLAEKTQELATMVRSALGVETYTQLLTTAQVSLTKKRWQRRADHQQLAVSNPQVALKRKKKKQESAKSSKKMKMQLRKGKVAVKNKLRNLAIVS